MSDPVRTLALVLLAACGGSTSTTKPVGPEKGPDPDGPHKAAVAAQVKPYIEGKILTSVVVGLIEDGKREVYGFAATGAPPTGHSLFELGSATKVYTGLLLADAVQRKEVDLDQPVSDLLPAGVTVPTAGKDVITLRHLALHASGLPRIPKTLFARGDAKNPYANFSEDDLYLELATVKLDSAPGEKIVYSNFGVGLLGCALGRKAGPGYKEALAERILGPLDLDETFAGTVPPEAAKRIVPGTTVALEPTPRWTFEDTLAGAGSIVSSADDQLAFLAAQLDAATGGKGTLRPQMRLAQEAQLQNDGDNEGLGWQIDAEGRFWHNGATAGYHSYIGFDPKNRRAVVVLAATSTTLAEWLAAAMFSVLEGSPKPPIVLPTEAQLASYVGKYNASGGVLEFGIDAGRLTVQVPNSPPFVFAPIGPRAFWGDDLQMVVEFAVDEKGVVSGVAMRSGKEQVYAERQAAP